MMTKPEAWREVARIWAEREEGWRLGLCSCVRLLYYRDKIGVQTYCHMRERIDSHLGNRIWAYNWRSNESNDHYADRHREARTLAALWLALEAEEDGQ